MSDNGTSLGYKIAGLCGVGVVMGGVVELCLQLRGKIEGGKAEFELGRDEALRGLDEETDCYEVQAWYDRAGVHGCESQTQFLKRFNRMLADKVRPILQNPHDPLHFIQTTFDLEELLNFYPHRSLDVTTQLSTILPAKDVIAFRSWYTNAQYAGWKAAAMLVWQHYPTYIIASLGTCVVGVVTPVDTLLGGLFLKELRVDEPDKGKMVRLCVCIAVWKSVVRFLKFVTQDYASQACAPAMTEVKARCAERAAQCDTKLLATIDMRSFLDSVDDDQDCILEEMESTQHTLSAVAHLLTLVFPLLRSAHQIFIKKETTTDDSLFAAAAGVSASIITKAMQYVVGRVIDKIYLTDCASHGKGPRDMYDVLSDMADLKNYRVPGREVELVMQLAEGQADQEGDVDPYNGALETFSRGAAVAVVRHLTMVAVCCYTGAGLTESAVAQAADMSTLFHALRRGVGMARRSQSWMRALRMHQVLHLERTIDLGDEVGSRDLLDHTLLFDGVSFGYNVAGRVEEGEEEEEEIGSAGKRDVVLKNLTLKVPAGQHVGIAGPSGCGKSTLMSLVSRLYDPNEGSVILGGRDLKEYNVGWLRREVVSGTGTFMKLVDGSIYDNVKLSRPAATPEEAMQALRMACAVDFVQEKGLLKSKSYAPPELSAGQEARVFLARALVAKPKILVLDEVSAHLDPVVEEALRKQLAELTRAGTTIINVSHRLSFLKNCDIVHVFDEVGEISASGTHKHLLKTCEWFKEACNNQTLRMSASMDHSVSA